MSDNENPLARIGHEIPRFAPNFSVYLLQPDVICLYSEDRKFLLHGEIYGVLAAAIAKGGKSFLELAHELEKSYPPERIHAAFRRMLERRYILPSSHGSHGLAAAYWTSLGFSPQTAASHLKNCSVRLRSLDVEGAAELKDALKELGVRIATRDAALTLVLVSDYLDPRLEELNEEFLAAKKPWALVQPSGIFPLVGPLFRPGEGACWSCLADRMRRNREVRALLDRKDARRLTLSPLARSPLGRCGVELAAIELAKAIATDFRTPLSDHILSLDLLGANIAKHYVGRRPQCPACGVKKLRDPRRSPAPIELGDSDHLVMTSGGYRSVSPAATVARFRKHVSPLTGVVSRLERIEADLPLNTNFCAQHNFTGLAETVGELRSGMQSGSFGKGSTAEQGEASALMEAIERYSGIFQGDEIRAKRRFLDFAPGDAIAPNDVLLFSQAQLRRGAEPGAQEDVEANPAVL